MYFVSNDKVMLLSHKTLGFISISQAAWQFGLKEKSYGTRVSYSYELSNCCIAETDHIFSYIMERTLRGDDNDVCFVLHQ